MPELLRRLLGRLRSGMLERLRDADDWFYERPVRRQRVLFVFPDPYGWACQAPVAAQLLARGDVQVRALWDRPDEADQADAFCSERDRSLFEQLRIGRTAASIAKWHIVVDSHLCRFYPKRRALRAYLHHGAGFGSGGGVAAAERCEVYLGLSEAERRFIEQQRPSIFDQAHAFFPVGFPKADALVDGSFDRAAILASLGLPDRHTILITSHYTPTSILRALGAELLAHVATAFPDSNVIQTGHPWLWRSEVDEELEAWRQKLYGDLRAVLAEHPNTKLVTDMLAEPLAAASDLLVADSGSSALTIFGLLDRPIVCFANAEARQRGKPGTEYYYKASEVIQYLDDAADACIAARRDPSVRAEARREIRDVFYPNAGFAAKRTSEVLREIGVVCSTRSPGWSRVMELSEKCIVGLQGGRIG